MKAVIQRVKNANVKVDGEVTGEIGQGLLVLLGVGPEDTEKVADELVQKICKLRIFTDENDKMNLSIKDIDGEILVVSQFTLYADCQKGNRPSFVNAAPPDKADKLYEYFKEKCSLEVKKVASGIFRSRHESKSIKRRPSNNSIRKVTTKKIVIPYRFDDFCFWSVCRGYMRKNTPIFPFFNQL